MFWNDIALFAASLACTSNTNKIKRKVIMELGGSFLSFI